MSTKNVSWISSILVPFPHTESCELILAMNTWMFGNLFPTMLRAFSKKLPSSPAVFFSVFAPSQRISWWSPRWSQSPNLYLDGSSSEDEVDGDPKRKWHVLTQECLLNLVVVLVPFKLILEKMQKSKQHHFFEDESSYVLKTSSFFSNFFQIFSSLSIPIFQNVSQLFHLSLKRCKASGTSCFASSMTFTSRRAKRILSLARKSQLKKDTAMPVAPARPVRPIRWM